MRSLAQRRSTPAALVAWLLAAYLFVLACAVGAGHLLALAERSDGSTAIDARITSWTVAHRDHVVTVLARSFSTIGSNWVLAPVIVLVAAGLAWRRRYVLGGLLILAWGGSIGMYTVAKYLVGRQRPPVEIRLSHVAGSSYPSGHAMQSLSAYVALAIAGTAVWSRARVPAWTLAAVLAAGVGWSRVYLGVHWATDVAAGWLTAAAWTAIVVLLAARAASTQEALRPRSAGQM
jgi:undecaprenyl-diphosphatase